MAYKLSLFDQTSATLHTQGEPGVRFGNQAKAEEGKYVALVADWVADQEFHYGLFDTTNSTFYLRDAGGSVTSVRFGNLQKAENGQYQALAGDWNGEGEFNVGLFDTTNSTFYLRDADGTVTSVRFGNQTKAQNGQYQALAGDWNGDGEYTVGLFDTTNGTFYLRDADGSVTSVRYGNLQKAQDGDYQALVGDWNGDGEYTVGLFDTTNGTFYLRAADGSVTSVRYGNLQKAQDGDYQVSGFTPAPEPGPTPGETFTLAEAIAEGEDLPDEYNIKDTNDNLFPNYGEFADQAEEILDGAQAIEVTTPLFFANYQLIAGLENFDVANLTYDIAGPFAVLWDNQDVVDAAGEYTITDPENTNFGIVDAEEKAFIEGAANWEEGYWSYAVIDGVEKTLTTETDTFNLTEDNDVVYGTRDTYQDNDRILDPNTDDNDFLILETTGSIAATPIVRNVENIMITTTQLTAFTFDAENITHDTNNMTFTVDRTNLNHVTFNDANPGTYVAGENVNRFTVNFDRNRDEATVDARNAEGRVTVTDIDDGGVNILAGAGQNVTASELAGRDGVASITTSGTATVTVELDELTLIFADDATTTLATAGGAGDAIGSTLTLEGSADVELRAAAAELTGIELLNNVDGEVNIVATTAGDLDLSDFDQVNSIDLAADFDGFDITVNDGQLITTGVAQGVAGNDLTFVAGEANATAWFAFTDDVAFGTGDLIFGAGTDNFEAVMLQTYEGASLDIGAGGIQLNGADLILMAAGDMNLGTTAITDAASIISSGDGTGDITLTVGGTNLDEIILGAGDDTLTVGGTAEYGVDLGGGDNVLNINAAVAADSVFRMGDGDDEITIAAAAINSIAITAAGGANTLTLAGVPGTDSIINLGLGDNRLVLGTSVDVTTFTFLNTIFAEVDLGTDNLTINAAQIDGAEVAGTGDLTILALDETPDADFSAIGTDAGTVAIGLDDEDEVVFTGAFAGRAFAIGGTGTAELDITGATLHADTSFDVDASQTLILTAAQADERTVDGTGEATIVNLQDTADADLSDIAVDFTLELTEDVAFTGEIDGTAGGATGSINVTIDGAFELDLTGATLTNSTDINFLLEDGASLVFSGDQAAALNVDRTGTDGYEGPGVTIVDLKGATIDLVAINETNGVFATLVFEQAFVELPVGNATVDNFTAGTDGDILDFSALLAELSFELVGSAFTGAGALTGPTDSIIAFSFADFTSATDSTELANAFGTGAGGILTGAAGNTLEFSTNDTKIFIVSDDANAAAWLWRDGKGGTADGVVDEGELILLADLTGINLAGVGNLDDANFGIVA